MFYIFWEYFFTVLPCIFDTIKYFYHHHHQSLMELVHLLTRFIYPNNAQLDCPKRMLKFTLIFTLKVLLHVLFHGPDGPWNSTVRTDLDIYTGFTPSQLMTNTSGCCYSL